MTLDEAIKHAEEVAIEQDKLCKRYDDASRYYRSHNEDIVSANAKKCLECFECAKEHRQLAEWLKELKQLREQTLKLPKNTTNGEIIRALFPNIDKAFSNVIDLNLLFLLKIAFAFLYLDKVFLCTFVLFYFSSFSRHLLCRFQVVDYIFFL